MATPLPPPSLKRANTNASMGNYSRWFCWKRLFDTLIMNSLIKTKNRAGGDGVAEATLSLGGALMMCFLMGIMQTVRLLVWIKTIKY